MINEFLREMRERNSRERGGEREMGPLGFGFYSNSFRMPAKFFNAVVAKKTKTVESEMNITPVVCTRGLL